MRSRCILSGRWRGLRAAMCSAVGVAGCGAVTASAGKGQIVAVGAENEYANVISQIGGRYVAVTRDREQPEHRPAHLRGQPERRAARSAAAQLVVQNGVGYDTFMNKIEAASPELVAQGDRRPDSCSGLPDSTPNPHLWYTPPTMPAVAKALVEDLVGDRAVARRATSQANAKPFDASLQPWYAALKAFAAKLPAHAGRDDRAGRRLHAAGGRDDQPDPVHVPGRHHERRRPLAAGRDPPGRPVLGAPGQGVPLQPAGHRLADRVVPRDGQAGRDPGRRGLRDDADAGLRLPVVDAGRGQRAAEGRGRRGLDREAE